MVKWLNRVAAFREKIQDIQLNLNNYVPSIIWDILKNYSFFIWNSNLTGHLMFYRASQDLGGKGPWPWGSCDSSMRAGLEDWMKKTLKGWWEELGRGWKKQKEGERGKLSNPDLEEPLSQSHPGFSSCQASQWNLLSLWCPSPGQCWHPRWDHSRNCHRPGRTYF